MRISPSNNGLHLGCFDPNLALQLKTFATVLVFFSGSMGVAIPLLGRRLKILRSDGSFFAVTKAFAAGVILSTGFVHILPDAQAVLSNSRLPDWPWSQFPFAGFVAMFAALMTLLTEVLSMEYYENQNSHSLHQVKDYKEIPKSMPPVDLLNESETLLLSNVSTILILGGPEEEGHCPNGNNARSGGCQGSLHICDGPEDKEINQTGSREVLAAHVRNGVDQLKDVQIRNIVISQVLEVAVIAHSFIVGISLGVSENPCTIKPLMAALCFHQFFEGFALGGCISVAGFKILSASLRAGAFAITTPFGILVGIFVASVYGANTPRAFVVEGLFDAASAGILIHMALVNLIATDILSERMRSNAKLRTMVFFALFGGALSMSALAFWV